MSQLPTWSDSLFLGDYTIDQQYKHLIELRSRVADYNSANAPSEIEKHHRFLKELAELTEAHLTKE